MTWEQAGKAVLSKWQPEEAVIMLAIGAVESGQWRAVDGDPVSNYPQYAHFGVDGYLSFGWWQVFVPMHYDKLKRRTGSDNPRDWRTYLIDLNNNIDTAREIYDSAGRLFTPWSAYKGGQYKQHLPRAQQVINALLGSTDMQPTLIKWSPNIAAHRPPSKKIVIIHATRSGTPGNPSEFEGTVNWLTRVDVGLSIHLVVDRDGIRWARLVPDDKCAVHAGQHNTETWGIEVCQPVNADGYTEPQMKLLARICKALYVDGQGVAPQHITSMTGSGFIGHEETPQGRAAGKSDPGSTFNWPYFISLLSSTTTPPAPIGDDDVIIKHEAWAGVTHGQEGWFNPAAPREIPGGAVQRLNAYYDFGVPEGTRWVEVEFMFERGYAIIVNGDNSHAFRVGDAQPRGTWTPAKTGRVWLDEGGWFSVFVEDVENPVKIFFAHAVAYGT